MFRTKSIGPYGFRQACREAKLSGFTRVQASDLANDLYTMLVRDEPDEGYATVHERISGPDGSHERDRYRLMRHGMMGSVDDVAIDLVLKTNALEFRINGNGHTSQRMERLERVALELLGSRQSSHEMMERYRKDNRIHVPDFNSSHRSVEDPDAPFFHGWKSPSLLGTYWMRMASLHGCDDEDALVISSIMMEYLSSFNHRRCRIVAMKPREYGGSPLSQVNLTCMSGVLPRTDARLTSYYPKDKGRQFVSVMLMDNTRTRPALPALEAFALEYALRAKDREQL